VVGASPNGAKAMKSYKDWKKEHPEPKDLLNDIGREVHSIAPQAEIILYGSRARGDNNFTSDWDLLILVDQPLNRALITNLKNRLYELELETDTVLSSIIRTREEWYSPRYSVLPFKHAVEQEGIPL
jgi:predicted nucleotidyltransferase